MQRTSTIIIGSLGLFLALMLALFFMRAQNASAMHTSSLGSSIRMCVQDLKDARDDLGDLTWDERRELRREFRLCVRDAVHAFIHHSASSKSKHSSHSSKSKSSRSMSHSSMSSSSMSSQSSLMQVNIDIDDDAFSPQTVTVKQGTTVRWENEDDEDHTVTGDTAGGPNSGTLDEDDSYSFTFNALGTYPYHCTFHPTMTGSVIVIP